MGAAVPFAVGITLLFCLEGGRGPRPELGRSLSRLQLSTFSVTLRTYIRRLLGHLVFFSARKQEGVTKKPIIFSKLSFKIISPTR